MSVAFYRGQQLGRGDLDIFLEDPTNGLSANAYEIYYTLQDVTTGSEVTVGSLKRAPANPSLGEYYASIVIPLDANLGLYRIRWTFRERVGAALEQVVQEFEVIDKVASAATTLTACEASMIKSLRYMCMDLRPDRTAHFRPPAHEETIGQFNKVFGFLWQDDELKEFIERSIDMVNLSPPMTGIGSIEELCGPMKPWRTVVLTGALYLALQAMSILWVSEEFGYSIGGVSLDLERSSKYESARSAAYEQFQAQLEKAKATVNVIRGIKQPKYGIGVRSSFGAYVGRGVLSPRSFMGI